MCDFTKQISNSCKKAISDCYASLKLVDPTTLRDFRSHTSSPPDIVIFSEHTKKSLIIHIRSGIPMLPVGFYPSMKRMYEEFKGKGDELVVVTDAPFSPVLSQILAAGGIPVIVEPDAEKVPHHIENKLKSLDNGGSKLMLIQNP